MSNRTDANAQFGRGLAKYLKADWTGAIADFKAAARIMPSNTFYLVWLAKAHLRGGIPLPPQQFAEMGDNSSARHVIEAFMSDYNPEQFMAGVRAGAAYTDRRNHDYQCETSLFMGEWLVLRKKGKGAREMFADAEAHCRPLSVERTVASAELSRLDQP